MLKFGHISQNHLFFNINFVASLIKPLKKHSMANPIDAVLPKAFSGKTVEWLTFFSVLLIIGFVVDNYWGKGDLFGLAKKKSVTPQAV